MKASEQIENFWREFCVANPQVNPGAPFQIWHFGNTDAMAKELCSLVLQGKKTATAALPWEYEDKPEDAPVLHGYSVVTDFAGNPQCVLRTTEIRVLPFNRVDAEFAFDEGEGDQSLDYWREVHWDYFSRQCARSGKEPTPEMLVNCERFELLYPLENE
jgi:uncharacterized protein YhfF